LVKGCRRRVDEEPEVPFSPAPATPSERTRQRKGEAPLKAQRRAGLEPGLLVGADDDEILRCFLALVRTWRGADKRAALRLRRADIAVLVAILGTDRAEIERRLIAATACSRAAATRGRRLLLAGLGAVVIGLAVPTVAGAGDRTDTATSAGDDRRRAPIVASSPVPPTATTAMLAPAATEPAATEPDATAPEATAPGATAPDVEGTVSVPSLGIDLPIVEGGQSVIDEGVVAHYTAAGWKDPVAAGAPGTYWLAAHHVTHGGPFRALPAVAIGAEIRVTEHDRTFVYVVTSTEVVGLLPGDVAIYGTDTTAPVILLQTCTDDTHRFLVHGRLQDWNSPTAVLVP
jgi:LPXTG-site transpeptidase (sortase) family protein